MVNGVHSLQRPPPPLCPTAPHHSLPQDLDARLIVWKRVVDMNDRALRKITIGLGGIANGGDTSFATHFVTIMGARGHDTRGNFVTAGSGLIGSAALHRGRAPTVPSSPETW